MNGWLFPCSFNHAPSTRHDMWRASSCVGAGKVGPQGISWFPPLYTYTSVRARPLVMSYVACGLLGTHEFYTRGPHFLLNLIH